MSCRCAHAVALMVRAAPGVRWRIGKSRMPARRSDVKAGPTLRVHVGTTVEQQVRDFGVDIERCPMQ